MVCSAISNAFRKASGAVETAIEAVTPKSDQPVSLKTHAVAVGTLAVLAYSAPITAAAAGATYLLGVYTHNQGATSQGPRFYEAPVQDVQRLAPAQQPQRLIEPEQMPMFDITQNHIDQIETILNNGALLTEDKINFLRGTEIPDAVIHQVILYNGGLQDIERNELLANFPAGF